MIELPHLSAAAEDGWRVLFRLHEVHGDAWTLIGAQMVALHAYERGIAPPRASLDFDILADVRMVTSGGTEQISRTLRDMAFELDEPDPDGLSHRFRRDNVAIDVLAPDHIGDRASRTTLPPAHTVMVKGGTRALETSETVAVSVGGEHGLVRRPDLLGAVVVKAAAVDVDDLPRAQEGDLMFLLSLVDDPDALQPTAGDRQLLRRRRDLLERRLDGLTAARALEARSALAALTRDAAPT